MKTKKLDRYVKLKIVSYLLLFVICFGVNKTYVYNANLMPFGVGIVFSLLSIKFNGYIMSPIYVLSCMLANFNISSLLASLNVAVVLCVLEYLFQNKKLKNKKWIIFVSALFSQIVYISVSLGDSKENLALLVSIILGLLFLYSCLVFLDALVYRKMIGRLNLDEKICGCVILLIFMYGMSSTNVWLINLGLLISPIILLSSVYILKGGLVFLISALLGVSYSAYMLSPMFLSLFVFMTLFVISFKSSFKFITSIALVLSYVIFVVIFNMGITYSELISLSIGAILFLLIPNKLLSKLSVEFDKKYNVIVNNVLTNTKHQIVKRVKELSQVFDEMNGVYKDMVKGNLDEEKAKELIKEELLQKVCGTCKNYNLCFRTNGNFMDNSIDTVVGIAYEKDKVLLMDFPQHLSSNCINLNAMITNLNNLISAYKDYRSAINNLDSSRMLIATQLGGVSSLLSTLANEVDVNINLNVDNKEKIIEELNYKNIVCLDATVYEKDISNKNLSLVIKDDTFDESLIEKTVSKIMKNKMQIVGKDFVDGEFSVVNLQTRPNYDIAFGCNTITKAGKVVSGDSNTIIKIDNDKYMVSICDGMGSGGNAHSISSLSISLIEKFYLAGFDNEIILNSVNKLLSLTETESFSTIDLCVIDCKKNTYDFIKLGATVGFLKRQNGETETIESSGLPVGVLEEIHPHITKKLISPYDMLVFVSDGITDSFENKIDLKEFINHTNIINPKTLSKNILDKAIELNEGIAKDDMTVVCVRVFENV